SFRSANAGTSAPPKGHQAKEGAAQVALEVWKRDREYTPDLRSMQFQSHTLRTDRCAGKDAGCLRLGALLSAGWRGVPPCLVGGAQKRRRGLQNSFFWGG